MTDDDPPVEPLAWWRQVEPDVEALARKIAGGSGVNVDQMAMPYGPPLYHTTSGLAAMIDTASLRPFWTFSISAARHVLAMRDEMAVEQVLAPVAEPTGTFTDDDPITAWRLENGLDASQTD